MTAALSNIPNGPFATGVDGYVYPQFLGIPKRAPTTLDIYQPGTRWQDNSVSPPVIYQTTGAGNWIVDTNAPATTSTYGTVLLTDNSEPVATKVYADNLAIMGSPVATTTTSGIGKLVSDNNAVTRLASSGVQAYFVQPSNLTAVMSSPGPIGDTVPSTGAFTDLSATGTFSIVSAAAITIEVTGAAADLTLESDLGSTIIKGGEAVADAIQINTSDVAGGIDVQSGTGGFDLDTTGAVSLDGAAASNLTTTSGDLTLSATTNSIVMSAAESVADAIQLTTSGGAGGITMTLGTGGFNPTTSGKFTLVSTDNAAQSFYLHANGGTSETIQLRADQGTGDASVELLSDVGGVTLTAGKAAATAINFTTSNAAGGITMTVGTGGILPTTTGKFTVISTDNAAQSIELHANGGTSETIRLRADQGTAATSLDLLSDVGGITLNAGLASASAINITSSNVGGGWTLNSGTAGVTLANTGKLSLAAAAASDITVTGAFNLTLATSLGRLIGTAGIAAANAITLTTGNAAGGFSLTSGTGGFTLTNTGLLSLAGSGASNITIATGDLSIIDTASSIIINAGEAVADAIQLTTANAAGGVTGSIGTGGFNITTTGAMALDSATASHLKVTGAADLTLQSTAGAVNVISGEANLDSINVTSAGGMNIVATGAAAKDIIITNTNGSMTLTAGENVTDAMNFTANGLASRINLTAGTGSIKFASGWVVPVTTVLFVDSPYTVLGTDYFISVDTSGGAITVTLPNAATLAGRTYVIRDTGGAAAASNITIGTGGGNLVGGGASAATKVISAAYAGATVYSNGVTWNYCYVA
jgi:hypothetical protein